MTSTAQIADLIQGNADLKIFYDGARARIDAALDDLPAVVRRTMNFGAIWDPDELSPDNATVFSDLDALIGMGANGGWIRVDLLPGRTYHLTRDYTAAERSIRFQRRGEGVNPVLKPAAYLASSGQNRLRALASPQGEMSFLSVDIDLTAAKADAAASWDATRRVLVAGGGDIARIVLQGGTITGADGVAVTTCQGATINLVTARTLTLNGACHLVRDLDQGSAVIAARDVTLAGGATLAMGGTLGTNLLTQSSTS